MDYATLLTPHPNIYKTFFHDTIKLPTWTTQEGHNILICQMETSHIRNVIRLLTNRKANRSPKMSSKFNDLENELKKRGKNFDN